MTLTLPRIYPITDTRISGLSHLEQVRHLIDGGASFIQLRDKEASAGAFYNSAVEVMKYARRYDVKILINDRVDIAKAVDADGVHLGQDDLDPVAARALLGDEKIIGYSTHSIAQAEAAMKLPIDYIAVGPIFGTSTKVDHDPVVGLEGIRDVRELVGDTPLVAIGGIGLADVESVLAAGANTVAVISEILSKPDEISNAFRKLCDAANIFGNG